MITMRKRFNRCTAPVVLGLGLLLTPAFTPPARAQDVPDASGEEKGRPFDGYFATSALMLLVLFLVGKSARR